MIGLKCGKMHNTINLTGNQIGQHIIIFEKLIAEISKKENCGFDDFIKIITNIINTYEKNEKDQNSKLTPGANKINSNELSKKTNKIKGDIFEVFAEIFFNTHDLGHYIENYKSIPPDEDFGVDGRGQVISEKSGRHGIAVQVKYRTNPKERIEYGCLSKTFTDATLNGYIDPALENEKDIWVMTTSNIESMGLPHKLKKRLKIINRDIIEKALKGHKGTIFFKEIFIPTVKNFKERLPQ